MLLVRKSSAGNEDLFYIAFALGSNLFNPYFPNWRFRRRVPTMPHLLLDAVCDDPGLEL
jgi:hypothetical protein